MAQTNEPDAMEGVEVTASEAKNPLFTEQEKRVLDVYDRLEELQLEIALLKARGVLSQNELVEASEQDIENAQRELLKAKAAYQVRHNVIEQVLVASPILSAVHAGNNASVAEQDLLPLTEQRDKLSVNLAELSAKVQSTRDQLMKVESQHGIQARENTQLAGRMLALAEEANIQKKDDIHDAELRQQVDDAEKELKIHRQRWRIMKGTASGVVVGSGVDWANDPKLLEIVLDEDEAEN